MDLRVDAWNGIHNAFQTSETAFVVTVVVVVVVVVDDVVAVAGTLGAAFLVFRDPIFVEGVYSFFELSIMFV